MGARLGERAFQHLQFTFASDKDAETPAHCCFKPRRSLANGVEPIGLLRLGFALDGVFASKARLDYSLHQPVRRFAHEHGIRLGQRLQARREVDGVAEHGDCRVGTILNLPTTAAPVLRPIRN